MARIIRVETMHGEGLYRPDHRLGFVVDNGIPGTALTAADIIAENTMSLPGLISDEWYSRARPTPNEDGMSSMYRNLAHWAYGFKSYAQLAAWFEHKVKPRDILDMGFQIQLVEATNVQYGRSQCRYKRNSVINKVTIVDPEYVELYKFNAW